MSARYDRCVLAKAVLILSYQELTLPRKVEKEEYSNMWYVARLITGMLFRRLYGRSTLLSLVQYIPRIFGSTAHPIHVCSLFVVLFVSNCLDRQA